MRVILNPASRGGEGKRMRNEIERILSARQGGVEVVETQGPQHAVELATRAVGDGVSVVVAAGGDGTVHEVANGIMQALTSAPGDELRNRVAMGIIPVGTGNDFVKVVPGTGSRTSALDTLLHGRPRPFDVGLAEWDGGRAWFMNAMGTGIDVEVVRQIQRLSRGPGALVYLQGLLRALMKYQPIPLTVTADGVEISREIMIAAVANGCCVGGSFRLTPGALPDDGHLDLCIVGALSVPAQMLLVPRILRGTHGSSPSVDSRRVHTVTLSVPPGVPLYFQLDGELHEHAGIHSIRVTIQPASLQIVAAGQPSPAGSPHSRSMHQSMHQESITRA